MLNSPRAARRSRQRGLGLVELLVGLALGLFVVAGGLLLFAGFVDSDRRLVVETRMLQDLRAASDIVTRDIRRGGYWQNAHTQVWTPGAPTNVRNPFTVISTSACAAATAASAASDPTGTFAQACYWIDVDGDNVVEDSERYGFSVNNGVLQAVYANGAATDLTDPNAVTITGLAIQWTSQANVYNGTQVCAVSCVANCPTVVIREAQITLTGRVPGDLTIPERALTSNVRVRNDHFAGQCPT
jgi:prepilin peptidase dependent protein B